MSQENFMQLTIKAIPENVGVARLSVAVFASQLDFTVSEIDEIKVAVSEAVTNAVVHAYRDTNGTVTISAETRAPWLVVVVADEGIGIDDVDKVREHGYSSDPERLGMGFYFMETLMDAVEVESEPGRGTRVVLRRRARSAQQTEDETQSAVS